MENTGKHGMKKKKGRLRNKIIAAVIGIFAAGLIAVIVMPYDDEDFGEDDTENLKSANIDPEEDKKTSSKSESEKDSKLHSDEDFDNYFKDEK